MDIQFFNDSDSESDGDGLDDCPFDPFERSEVEFRKRYRFGKRTMRLLLDELQPLLEHRCRKGNPWPWKLAVSLSYRFDYLSVTGNTH